MKKRRRETLKIYIKIDTEKNPENEVHDFITHLYNNEKKNPGQQKLEPDNKIICNKCGINLYDKYDNDTVTKIKNFCKIKYKDKIYCKDCQQTLNGGGD